MESGGLSGEYEGSMNEIFVGQVTARGKDLPSGKNLADYIDPSHKMDCTSFLGDHTKYFLTKCTMVSLCVTEAGCEHLFGLSGYISSLRRTRLGMKNYEMLAMFAQWVAKDYLPCCKKESWKDESNNEALKFGPLEHLIEAETCGLPVQMN
ncbi:hypothetical protein ACHAWX_000442 [Stephanocyclus meneghinianus]